jgi:hypothetical protein
MLVYMLTLRCPMDRRGNPALGTRQVATPHGSTVPMPTSGKAAHPSYRRSVEGNDPRGGRHELRLQHPAV